MTDTLNITTVDDPIAGFFRVMLEDRCVATFYYCTEEGEGFFTKKQAKKLANKLVRKIENSTTIKTKKGFKLKRNNTNKVFVRYTPDEAIILFNYQPVLRIPIRYKLGDQKVDMCREVVNWANQIVEDLNKTKNENESRTRKS